MENLSGNIVALLQYLVPGFVVAWIFYGFTSHPKPSQFERIVQALVFTVIVRLIVEAERIAAEWIGNRFFVLASWSPNADLAAALLTSIVIGLGFALSANRDWMHAVARRFNLSSRSGDPNEHFAAFDMHRQKWVVLHLKDGTRLLGYPLRWPTDPSGGHYLLERVERSYVGEDDSEPEDLSMLAGMLVSAKDVKHVEFIKGESDDGTSSKAGTSTPCASKSPAR